MAYTSYKLVANPNVSSPAGVTFYLCDTEGDRPTSDLVKGDFAFTSDTDKLWIANSTTTWKDTAGSGGGGADVKSGTVSITENSTVTITFASAFSATPVVTANVQDSGGENNNVQIDAVSTTEATLKLEKVGGGASSTYNVGWIATDAGN